MDTIIKELRDVIDIIEELAEKAAKITGNEDLDSEYELIYQLAREAETVTDTIEEI